MLDIRWMRENLHIVRKNMVLRGDYQADFEKNTENLHLLMKKIEENIEELKNTEKTTHEIIGVSIPKIDELMELDRERRTLISEVEKLKEYRKKQSKDIGIKAKNKEDVTELKEEMKGVADKIKDLDEKTKEAISCFEEKMAFLPNLLQEKVPVGATEEDGVVYETWGTPSEMNFQPKDHVEVGTALDIIDFERGAKISGSRFAFLKGKGAILERALSQFMLDVAAKNDYTELMTPYLVHSNALFGTGQLPKFEEDLFKCEQTGHYLIPTAEVPVTNYYQNEILEDKDLPIKYCSFTPCFRSEAGNYGKDTRGYIRMHQFNKVELVKFTRPEDSEEEHMKLIDNASEILRLLNLPHRKMDLCSADVGFSASRCVDLEVWFPSQGKYREISSCSNFMDFQARRAGIRFRRKAGDKPEFVHTINGSALAVGRTWVAILENYQTAEGKVIIPEALRKYTGFDVIE